MKKLLVWSLTSIATLVGLFITPLATAQPVENWQPADGLQAGWIRTAANHVVIVGSTSIGPRSTAELEKKCATPRTTVEVFLPTIRQESPVLQGGDELFS